MKTYIVPVHEKHLQFVATLAKNKESAYNKVKAKYSDARKTGITISAVHVDYVSFPKV